VDEELEELRKEIARLSAELEMLEAKVAMCIEVTARLQEEIEGLKRRAKKPMLKEYVGALRAYERVEADEPEPREGEMPGPPAPRQPPSVNSGRRELLRSTVEIKDGLIIVALTPFLRAKIATLRSSGDPVGEILECFEDKRLEEALGLEYEVYVCRIRGEYVEARGERFVVWCRDLWEHLRPDVVGPTKFELESYVSIIPYVDPGKARTWVERLIELDRELSELDARIMQLKQLTGTGGPEATGSRQLNEIICIEMLRTTSEGGRPAPLPTYTFECARRLEATFNIRKWLGNLYILKDGRWLGEPESVDVLQAVMKRTFEQHGLHELIRKYSAFEREVLKILYAGAPRAEPVKAVRSGNYLII
jgi:FtsZ-binding cell division protein ZapB